jgi:hypothetical protein
MEERDIRDIEEHDIVELGTASIETRQPVFPPIFFDGLNFQFFRDS